MKRIKRRFGILLNVYSALRMVDIAQSKADSTQSDLERAAEAERRAADRATEAAREHQRKVAAAVQAEAALTKINPFEGVTERS